MKFNLKLSLSEILNFAGSSRDRKRKEVTMEDLRLLFDHTEYGEGWTAMAKHTHNIPQLDRMIIEDCNLVSGKVVAPHMNTKSYPFWLCPEYIAKRIDCSVQEATNLVDCWSILDATQKMVEKFISWTKAKGISKALPYFEKLAAAVAEVESINPDDATETDGPTYIAPQLYRYHVIGEYDDDEDDNKPWLECQPRWYQNLIKKVQNCNLDNILVIGKEIYQKNLNQNQAGVFWTEYNLRKAKLEKNIKLGPTARAITRRIAKANGNLASLGVWLYKAQQGQIKITNPPKKHEWTMIWKAYNQRKEVHIDV